MQHLNCKGNFIVSETISNNYVDSDWYINYWWGVLLLSYNSTGNTAYLLFIDFKEAYNAEVSYNTIDSFCIPRKIMRLITICLNESYRQTGVELHFVRYEIGHTLTSRLPSTAPLHSMLLGSCMRIRTVRNRMELISYWSMLITLICEAETLSTVKVTEKNITRQRSRWPKNTT
jgi:hypothetical protein